MQCEDIFQDFVVQCPETLKVNAQLDPGETYTWVITDKFDKEYSGEIISDADGHLSIPIEDLPVGLLTHYSGSFKLKILSGGVYQNEQCFPIKFLMAKYYDEIVFEVRAGTNVKNNIGCEFDCVSDGSEGDGYSILEFSNQASPIVIPWTTALAAKHGQTPFVSFITTTPVANVTRGLIEVVDGELTVVLNVSPSTGYIRLQ